MHLLRLLKHVHYVKNNDNFEFVSATLNSPGSDQGWSMLIQK